MKDTTNIAGMDGNLWNDIKIENIELEWYDNFGFTLKGTRANMKSYHVRIKGTWDENTNFFEIHHIEYKKLKKIIEEYSETKKSKGKDMNEKNEIRDGWYKIKNQKDVDEVWKLCYGLEKELPKHRIIEIVDGIWNGWFVKPEAILYEWFESGDVVYVRDWGTEEWVKAKYHSYSSVRSSQLVEASGYVVTRKQCISEAEWKEKEEAKKIIEVYYNEYEGIKKIIENCNKEKDMSKIRDGWYKLNWKVVNETPIWEQLPAHYLVYVINGLFYVDGENFLGYEVTKEMILHAYFNYGDVVYVRDRDTREWEKAKYLNYSNMNSSQMATVDNCSGAWKQCISEAEWKEKYKEKPMVINVIGDCATVALIPIHDNEEVTIMRCGDSITYGTEK